MQSPKCVIFPDWETGWLRESGWDLWLWPEVQNSGRRSGLFSSYQLQHRRRPCKAEGVLPRWGRCLFWQCGRCHQWCCHHPGETHVKNNMIAHQQWLLILVLACTLRPPLPISSPDEPRRSPDPVWADLAVQQGCALSSPPEWGDTRGSAKEEHHPGAFYCAQLHGQTRCRPLWAQPVGQIGTDQGE